MIFRKAINQILHLKIIKTIKTIISHL